VDFSRAVLVEATKHLAKELFTNKHLSIASVKTNHICPKMTLHLNNLLRQCSKILSNPPAQFRLLVFRHRKQS
jgi:hypothetical protein